MKTSTAITIVAISVILTAINLTLIFNKKNTTSEHVILVELRHLKQQNEILTSHVTSLLNREPQVIVKEKTRTKTVTKIVERLVRDRCLDTTAKKNMFSFGVGSGPIGVRVNTSKQSVSQVFGPLGSVDYYRSVGSGAKVGLGVQTNGGVTIKLGKDF